jgi:hypothetical protein
MNTSTDAFMTVSEAHTLSRIRDEKNATQNSHVIILQRCLGLRFRGS